MEQEFIEKELFLRNIGNNIRVARKAKNLSQAQVAVIEKALYSSNGNHENQIETLADKVAKFLKVQPKENSKEKFLATILHDYNYYLMELI